MNFFQVTGEVEVAYHDCAVVWAAGDDVVIVWAPVDVQHGACMPAYGGVGLINASRLRKQRAQRC